MIAQELGLSANARLDLGDTRVRALAGKPTGRIEMSDLYGKSNVKLSATINCGYLAEYNDGKVITPERRGYAIAEFNMAAIGSMSPASLAGYGFLTVMEESSAAYESTSYFTIRMNGHVPVDLFTRAIVVNVREFAAKNGVHSSFTNASGAVQNCTVWSWPLAINARGQIFPTSGARTLQLL
ncbi:MAG: hypothetical protein CMJ75_19175 [Planctomycetaceae bacterium]|nr:hypothetical protein [Planctomycetaceae bacterium]